MVVEVKVGKIHLQMLFVFTQLYILDYPDKQNPAEMEASYSIMNEIRM